MATMYAYQAFDYGNLNLNRLIANNTDFEFADNINQIFNGILYQDVVYFEHYSGGYVGSYFGGAGITFNNDQSKVTGGTVTGFFEEYWTGGSWLTGWLVQNFAYSAVSLANAAYTPATTDDYAAFAAILGGNDSISLSPFADVMRAHGGNDLINGNAGNDLIYGDAGDDTLNGGVGSDTLLGGAGNDIYVVDNVGDRVYETTTVGGSVNAGGTDTVRSGVNHTLSSFVEKLVLTGSGAINGTGNALANSLTGNAAANTLNGGSGADTLLGGAGNDTYVVDNLSDKVYETTTIGGSTNAGGTDTVRSSISYTLGSFVEKLVLTGANAINGTGNALANSLTGNAAANTLNGGSGADALLGGAGNDTYVVDNLSDKVYETTTIGGSTNAGGTDTVRSSISYTLGSFVEKLVLTGANAINGNGNTLANGLTGNAAANVLNGGSGNDTLVGGAGNDRLAGGAGGDRFVFTTKLGSDTVIDYLKGTDKLAVSQAGLKVGDGDALVEGALLRASPGGFSPTAELVIFSTNVGSLSTAAASAAIGSATSAYAVGKTALFAVDNGVSSALYLFSAADGNAAVSAGELSLLATLSGASSTGTADYMFVA